MTTQHFCVASSSSSAGACFLRIFFTTNPHRGGRQEVILCRSFVCTHSTLLAALSQSTLLVPRSRRRNTATSMTSWITNFLMNMLGLLALVSMQEKLGGTLLGGKHGGWVVPLHLGPHQAPRAQWFRAQFGPILVQTNVQCFPSNLFLFSTLCFY